MIFWSDIDYEYPANAAQGQGFADLLTSLRSAFDELAQQNGDTVPYQLTVCPSVDYRSSAGLTLSLQAAVAAGSANYANLVVPQMNSALSFLNLWYDTQASTHAIDIS